MQGWIKMHRKIMEWEWYTDPNTARLFLHLILSANHKAGSYKGIDIDRGQLITGRNKLSERTGISVRSIRTCLSRLEDTGEISIKPTNKYSLITICNYETYQGDIPLSDQHLTNKRPSSDQQATTNKNVKNENNKKIKDIIDFLNLKSGKKFRAGTNTSNLISSLLEKGYSVADIEKVITNKCKQWKNDPEMDKYLRPQTLFSEKFDSYLNEGGEKKSFRSREAYIEEDKNYEF